MDSLAEQAARLLDFSQQLDIPLLDGAVRCMINGTGYEQQVALNVLTALKEHEQAWTRVEAILRDSSNPETKYYGLQILQSFIESRWKLLPRNECEKMRDYVVRLIIETSSGSNRAEREKIFLGKLNFIMVLILTREWPKHWPKFIPAIVEASTNKSNDSLAKNNMLILKLLSEEVFNFSSGNITEIKAKHLKDAMCSDFSQIFQLCLYFLEKSRNAELVRSTLETLLRFLTWVPEGYIFETPLITMLTDKLLKISLFRNVTLECLTEIAGMAFPQYDDAFASLFSKTMLQLKAMLPLNTNIEAFAKKSVTNQQFIPKTAMYLCTTLMQHGQLMELREKDSVLEALQYLLLISEVEEKELFKICLEYWNALAKDLYREKLVNTPTVPTLMNTAGVVGNDGVTSSSSVRHVLYQPFLTHLRSLIIRRMVKPEEVLVVVNDSGQVVREFLTNTDSMNTYENMREILVYLTHLNCVDIQQMMMDKLERQVNGLEWSWKNLNTLCWAIGSISGAMHEKDEEQFFVTVIKGLLYLCEQKKGKENKAIIASNIMYVVGQYPRFLRAHWRFLKTVTRKLFEFMEDTFPGIQEMACDTFVKIAKRCSRCFVEVQEDGKAPFIDEILTSMNTIIFDLEPELKLAFYEAVGYLISAQSESMQEALIERYMRLPNQDWAEMMNQAEQNVHSLVDAATVRRLATVLKTNVRACQALGHPYVSQLKRIFEEMLNVYKCMSEYISGAIAAYGETNTMQQQLIKEMRLVKKETLKLISEWISRSNDPGLVMNHIIQPLFETALADYHSTISSAREPEVISMVATIVKKLEGHMTPHDIHMVFVAVFEPTLDMIKLNDHDHPEHRTELYLMLQALNNHCFPAIASLLPVQFNLVLDSIILAIKQKMRNVVETGLETLFQLLLNMSQNEAYAQGFYQAYYIYIVQHVLSVVTDTEHTAFLTTHAKILAYLFSLVEYGQVNVSLDAAAPVINPPEDVASTNVLYVQKFVAELLRNAFPHLSHPQLVVMVKGLFNLDQNVKGLREHLRDFLVLIKEFNGDDDSDLYLEERELELRRAQEEKRKVQMSVPGILNPHEIEEMQ